jgi:hypothetical protein
MTAIMITLPADIEWSEYERELARVHDGREVMNFKVPFLPRHAKQGDRCYLVWRDAIRGWMEITGLAENVEFLCSTTNRFWRGNFIQRSGPFHPIKPIPRQGFRGFRYVPDDLINTLGGTMDDDSPTRI